MPMSLFIQDALTFDDVLLRPKYSTIKTRSEVDLSVSLPKGFKFKIPIIPANMSDIINENMIIKMYELGAMSIMHRFSTNEECISLFKKLANKYGNDIFNYVGMSIGVKKEDYKWLQFLLEFGIKIFCVDIAHLDSMVGLEMIDYIATNAPDKLLIAGNVATGEAATRAWKMGADIVKVGIGASGICSTRLEAAAGVPQLSALIDVYEHKLKAEKELKRQLYFISDGGHKITADCVKSLCFADMVMLGGMLSGTDEASGSKIEIDGTAYISYNGSSTHKKDRVEGVKGLVKPKGPVGNIIKNICEGIQSGCSYQNCRNLKELKVNPTFVKLTNAGIKESNIHDVIIQETK
jgi:IMP dehydrogenase/GMP reductase